MFLTYHIKHPKPAAKSLVLAFNIALLVFLPCAAFCQKVLQAEIKPPDMKYDNFLIKGGEASQTSTAIMIDRKGFLWCGTENCLYRYDGIKYLEFRTAGNLPGPMVTDIFEDSEETIWCATSTGLYKADENSGLLIPYFPDSINKSGPANFIRSINEDKDGILWLRTNRDIFSFNTQLGKFKRFLTDSVSAYLQNDIFPAEDQYFAEDRFENKWLIANKSLYSLNNHNNTSALVFHFSGSGELNSNGQVNCVTADRGGNIWIGSGSSGLFRWNYNLKRTEKLELQPSEENKTNFNSVSAIICDKNGTIWAFGNSIFSNYNPVTGRIKNYAFSGRYHTVYEKPGSPTWINQAFQSDDGLIWMVNKDLGALYRFDPVKEKLTYYDVPNFFVYKSIMDKTGAFWFACIRNDIWRLVQDQFPYQTFTVNNSSDVARIHKKNIIEDDRGHIWMLYNKGIFRFSNFDITRYPDYKQFRFPSGDSIVGNGFMDSRGNLWFGSKTGKIIYYNPVSNSYKSFMDLCETGKSDLYLVPFFQEDRSGKIWVAASEHGLLRYSAENKKFEHIFNFKSEPENANQTYLIDFLIDSNDNFWILTNDSFMSFRMPEMNLSNYSDADGQNFNIYNPAIRIGEDNRKNIWILHEKSGLSQFDAQNNTFRKIKITDENNSSDYYDLLISRDNKILVAHNRGITVYNPATGGCRTIKTPRLQYDLQSYQIRSGEIFYINENQLFVFFRDLPSNRLAPPVYVTNILVNGTTDNKLTNNSISISSIKKIKLPFKKNTIQFEFAALNYLNPGDNLYRYFMPGVDKDTVLVAQGISAEYKSLPNGKYKFWVTGSNNDGVWNSSGKSIDIQIMAPWYRSKVAYITYIILLLFIIAAYTRIRTRILIREKIKLEAQIEAHSAELKIKNNLLAETDRIKTDFFTNISHEIRTPLTLILGSLETVSRKEIDNKRLTEYLDIMKRNSQRMMMLINQLLDISRLDAGNMKITLIEDDLIKYLRMLIYEFLSSAESKNIMYIADIPEKAYITWFDRDKVEKIISNLLSNAFKFTPQNGTVQCIIRIDPGKNDETKPNVEIRVLDSGPGISEDNLSRIFDRFYRVEGHTEDGGYGTGIGLSLVKEFVTLLHGKTEIASTQGKGSEFKILLPLGKDHLDREEYTILESSKVLSPTKMLEVITEKTEEVFDQKTEAVKMKVLIIEDNDDLRNYIKENMKSEYNILSAGNGRTGLNTAFTMMPDLIVTDIIMPDINGIQLCIQLKNDERTSHIPVIMLTAKATTDDKIEGLRAGADDYIIKPFYIEELMTRISNILANREKLRRRYAKFPFPSADAGSSFSVDDRFLSRTLKIVNENLRNYNFDAGSLQEHLGMSRMHITRKLRILTGLSPAALIRNIRLEKAADLLLRKNGNITEVANSVGISNPSNFTKSFRQYFGESPREYLKNRMLTNPNDSAS